MWSILDFEFVTAKFLSAKIYLKYLDLNSVNLLIKRLNVFVSSVIRDRSQTLLRVLMQKGGLGHRKGSRWILSLHDFLWGWRIILMTKRVVEIFEVWRGSKLVMIFLFESSSPNNCSFHSQLLLRGPDANKQKSLETLICIWNNLCRCAKNAINIVMQITFFTRPYCVTQRPYFREMKKKQTNKQTKQKQKTTNITKQKQITRINIFLFFYTIQISNIWT